MHSKQIANFPHFSKLDIAHQDQIIAITSQFPSYSDFNFTSIFSWDTNETTEVSILNNNLILKLPDYLTGEVTYSILGRTDINETAHTIFDALGDMSVQRALHFVPETFASGIDRNEFIVEDDRDDYDYMYSIPELVELPGTKFSKIRQAANRFETLYKDITIEEADTTSQHTKEIILDVLNTWAKQKFNTSHRDFYEKIAIERLLDHAQYFPLVTVIVHAEGIPVGFTISQALSQDEAIGHFEKADISFKHSFAFVRRATNRILLNHGIQRINYEQDLGLEGLRLAKLKYHPISFLKKYNIKKTLS